ncbi:MAG: T9SS type A sorting domain-containing protein [Paludibacteraceae bacterium]|nr:T9SS type A sorting domain-containing protein [Paludibacteraceae bacterium]
MNKKSLLAWSLLTCMGISGASAADQLFLIKDGKLQEGVVALEATEDAPDYFTEGVKAPDGSECVSLTHLKTWTEAKLYIEEGVNLGETHTLIIDYCFKALEQGNYSGKHPVLGWGFVPDTTENRYTKTNCSGWNCFDVKFKHYGKENTWVSDTSLVYLKSAELGKGNAHKLLLIGFNRENEAMTNEDANVLYIKNLRLVANKNTAEGNVARPFFVENFEYESLPTYSDGQDVVRYLVAKGEKSLILKSGSASGVANQKMTGCFALSAIDPEGVAISVDNWGDEVFDGDFNTSLKRLWETFGSELNSGSYVEGTENSTAPTPDFTKPFSIAPGAFYDTELFHSLLVKKELAGKGYYGFLDIPVGKLVKERGEKKFSVSFVAKTTSSIAEGSNVEVPVYIKFDDNSEILVTTESLFPAWKEYTAEIDVPEGASTMSILFKPNADYNYYVDNVTVAASQSYYPKGVDGSGLDAKDKIVVEFDVHTASIEANAANASAYFDGDNFIVKADEEIASISIIDMAGKTASVNGGEFNVSGFNKGIYVFVAKTVNGASISGKIIIE